MPLAPIFFVTLLVTFGLCLLFAAIALFYHRVAFRSGTTYTAMLCASGAGSLASSPFLLVAILFCFINIPLALLIAGLGVLLSLFFTVSSIRGGAPLPDDKAVYALFLTYATHLIAILIVISIVKPLYFPTAVTSLLGL